jgi:hypothetical protein
MNIEPASAEAQIQPGSQNGSHTSLFEILCIRLMRVEDALTELAKTDGLGAAFQREALAIRDAFHNRRITVQPRQRQMR